MVVQERVTVLLVVGSVLINQHVCEIRHFKQKDRTRSCVDLLGTPMICKVIVVQG